MEQLSDPIISQGAVEDIRCHVRDYMNPKSRHECFTLVGELETAFRYEVKHLNRATVKKLIQSKIKQLCKINWKK